MQSSMMLMINKQESESGLPYFIIKKDDTFLSMANVLKIFYLKDFNNLKFELFNFWSDIRNETFVDINFIDFWEFSDLSQLHNLKETHPELFV